ncbi:Ig-like domain-containing protein [Vibrio taketomensis]|uniref:Ig-like domain-containing protein n=1 Tax=Vibrio taketomensis TaxID=2572923 RepID=UPI00138A54E1|nr:Ig-like domain-containing protein [Vibrio taketomensis]
MKSNLHHLTCEASPQNIVEVHVFDKDGKPVAGKQPTLREASGNNLIITALSQSDSDGVATYRVVKNNQSQLGAIYVNLIFANWRRWYGHGYGANIMCRTNLK